MPKFVLSLSHDEALDFFMKSEQFHGFELLLRKFGVLVQMATTGNYIVVILCRQLFYLVNHRVYYFGF